MPDTNEKLGRMLLKGLVTLRESKGSLTLEDVGLMFMQMAGSLNPNVSPTDQFMHQEISRLANYITEAKREIFAITSDDKSETVLNDASQHLDEVIKHTEEATTSIMDAADEIMASANGLGGDAEQKIMNAAGRIYESCNFQDITGQRITKVMKLINHIEERVSKLNGLFGDTQSKAANDVTARPPSDKDLMNGPQLAGKAASQEEIDMLFSSLVAKK